MYVVFTLRTLIWQSSFVTCGKRGLSGFPTHCLFSGRGCFYVNGCHCQSVRLSSSLNIINAYFLLSSNWEKYAAHHFAARDPPRVQKMMGSSKTNKQTNKHKTSTTPSFSWPIPSQKIWGNSVPGVIFSHTMPKIDFHYSNRFSWEKKTHLIDMSHAMVISIFTTPLS